jgi:HPt (histidine-containing phosphotransfer) domain-containing protein
MNAAGPLPHTPALTALDPAALARLRELDPCGRHDVVAKVLRTYSKSLASARGQLTGWLPSDAGLRLPDALACEAMWRLAHTLKSSSASVGASALAGRCATVERLARQPGAGGLAEAAQAMLHEVVQAQQAVAAALGPDG